MQRKRRRTKTRETRSWRHARGTLIFYAVGLLATLLITYLALKMHGE